KKGSANAQAAAAKRSSRAIRSEGGVAMRGSSHEISHRQPGRQNWRSMLSSAIPKQLSVPSHTDPRAVAHGEMSPINRAKERRHEMDMRKAVIAALAGGSMLAGVAPDVRPCPAAAKLGAVDLDRAGAREVRGEHVLDFDFDLVPHRGEGAPNVLGDARVDLQLLAFVVDPRPARRGLRPVAVVD